MIPMERFTKDERRMLKVLRALSAQDRATLLAFGQFLIERDATAGVEPGAAELPEPIPDDPVHEPRPSRESVVAAVRRLRRVYPMIDPGEMLNETSALMAAHVLQGRPADQVIDELESLFVTRFDKRRSS